MSVNNSVNEIADILCEFLEVMIHNILYIRRLYPESIFLIKKKYGVQVRKSIHPEVNNYISEIIKAISFHLRQNQLKKIFITFLDATRIYEKCTFDILSLTENSEDVLHVKFEHQLRDSLLKIYTLNVPIEKTSEDDFTFRIELLTTEHSNAMFNDNPNHEEFPWVRLDTSVKNVLIKEIIPLCTFNLNCLKAQLYFETFK